jgi:hypothetical protein
MCRMSTVTDSEVQEHTFVLADVPVCIYCLILYKMLTSVFQQSTFVTVGVDLGIRGESTHRWSYENETRFLV